MSVVAEVTGRIGTVRLDNPKKHNVLDMAGWLALAAAVRTLSERDDIRALAIRGTGGRAFSAGSDISAFAEQRSSARDVRDYSDAIALGMRAIRACRHPTVAIIEGMCVGGGLEIAACCDLRVCSESSRFGAPINRLGLTMSHDEIEPLVQILGPNFVLEILLTGELINADRALAVGLVNRVWPDADILEKGYSFLSRISEGAPLVNRWHKKFVYRLMEQRMLTKEEREEAHDAFETDDYVEGRTAFVEKRDPDFTGS